MIDKILFVQPFNLKDVMMGDEILIWELYLGSFLRAKIPSLRFDVLYLPIERRNKNISIESYKEKEKFFEQMDYLISNLNFILDEKTMICVSVTTSLLYLSSKLIGEYFQEKFPMSIIIMGGAHLASIPTAFSYERSPVDYIIIGEGELPLYDLVKNFPKKQNYPVIISPKRIDNINELPPLDFSIIEKYIKEFKSLSISLSRGCPFECNFCMEKGMVKGVENVKAWRAYTPKRAIQEVKRMIEYGMSHGIEDYGFYDAIFGLNRNWLDKFLEEYNFQEIATPWIETRIDIMDEKLIRELDKKNINSWYGIESFSKKMLLIMNKSTNPTSYLRKFEKVYELHKDIERLFMINIMSNHPGETKESHDTTFKRLSSMVRDDGIQASLTNVRFYRHLPGTRVYNNFEFFNKNYGSIQYIPNWFQNEENLYLGQACVRPSSQLSLRESYALYHKNLTTLFKQNIENLKSNKSQGLVIRILNIKKRLKTLDGMKEEFYRFLDETKIES